MTDLSASLRTEFAASFRVAHPRVVDSSESGDGAVKLLIELEDGLLVETVAIGSRRDAAGGRSGRAEGAGGDASDLTVCVSTQVGCPLACTFCRSGAIEFRRNLTPGEIAAQVLLAERAMPEAAKGRRNVVYMGMGEPLLNTDGVIGSLDLLTDTDGFGIPPRRITVSTVGLPDEMGSWDMRLRRWVSPSVSMRGTTRPGGGSCRSAGATGCQRSSRRSTRCLLQTAGSRSSTCSSAARTTAPKTPGNSSVQLQRLAASGIRPHVNLIAFNPWDEPAPGPPHRPGTEEDAERFLGRVSAAGFVATLRRSRGRDVLAACGQLAATPA